MKYKKGDIIRDDNVVCKIVNITNTIYTVTEIGNNPNRIIGLNISIKIVDQAPNVHKYLDVLNYL